VDDEVRAFAHDPASCVGDLTKRSGYETSAVEASGRRSRTSAARTWPAGAGGGPPPPLLSPPPSPPPPPLVLARGPGPGAYTRPLLSST
jgi:hypothetical protein